MEASKVLKLWEPSHGAIVVNDLAKNSDRVKPGELDKIDGGFSVTRPLQNPAFSASEGEDMARSFKIGRFRVF